MRYTRIFFQGEMKIRDLLGHEYLMVPSYGQDKI